MPTSDQQFFGQVIVDTTPNDEQYQEAFAFDGARKVDEHLAGQLHRLVAAKRYNPARTLAVSIGCADASDLRRLLSCELASVGVGLEFSPSGARSALELARPLNTDDNRLIIIPGDVTQMHQEVESEIQRLVNSRDIETVLLLLNSVLHELPTRSWDFSFNRLVSLATRMTDKALISINEPCAARGWDRHQRIMFKSKNMSAEILLAHAQMVADRSLRCNIVKEIADPDALTPIRNAAYIGPSSIEIDVPHMIELVHKCGREAAPARYRHELGERVSWLSPERVQNVLALAHEMHEESHITTYMSRGFRDGWNRIGAQAFDLSGNLLPPPHTHFRLFCGRLDGGDFGLRRDTKATAI